MTLRIAVASGKGGTGKTTVSCGLSWQASRNGVPVSLVDCDVEEPNVNLFLKAPIEKSEDVMVLNPVVDMETCTGCGLCGEMCQFSGIVVVNGKPLVFQEMCHSCGGCTLVCPVKAITEKERPIGIIESGSLGDISYVGGRMNVGEAKAPPLISEVAKKAGNPDMLIYDAPPGTSCPVIETVRKSAFTILVTEPTPFGLNDLVLAVEMIRAVGLPFGVVINRSDAGDDCVEKYCSEEKINVLGRIPYSRAVAEAYAEGNVIEALVEEFGHVLEDILENSKKGAGIK